MTLISLRAAVGAFVLAGCTAALTGCGISSDTALPSSPETSSLGPIGGSAYGGQQPISGARVYVLATGTGGYGGASTSLLNATTGTGGSDSIGYYVLTNSNGYFQVSAAPSCTVGTQAYLYILGGNTGFGVNSVAALLAPLGSCTSGGQVIPPSTTIQANEVTTVVTAYTLAGFATSPTMISSGNTTLATTGLTNAMSTALNIVNIGTGFASATSTTGNAVVPVDKINLIANALAACINSAGSSSTGCTSLYSATGAVSGSDTAQVAITLAHSPFLTSANSQSLYTLGDPPSAVFPVNLSGAPADYTLGLQYKTPQYFSGGVTNYSLAVDSTGKLWTRGLNSAGTTSTFVKYSPLGVPSTTVAVSAATNSDYGPYIHLAIDSADNVWSGTVGGEIKIPSGATSATLLSNGSCAISSDTLVSTVFGSNGVAYAGDRSNGAHVWEFNSTGCTSGLPAPTNTLFDGYLAIENSGGFVASTYNSANGYIARYGPGATTATSFPAGGQFLTTDSSGDVWSYSTIGGNTPDQLLEYNSSNSGISPASGYTVGGMNTQSYSVRAGTEGVHIDGNGAAWLAVTPCVSSGNCYADLVVGLPANVSSSNTAITPSTGLALPNGETGAHALALDGSGNLWIAVTDGSLIQYVGLTTPVATPTLYNNVGLRP